MCDLLGRGMIRKHYYQTGCEDGIGENIHHNFYIAVNKYAICDVIKLVVWTELTNT